MKSLGQQERLVYMWRCECLCLCQSVCTAKDNSCKWICAGIVGIETELTRTAIQYLCLLARCKVQTRAFRIEQSFSGGTNCSLPWFLQTLAAHSQISKDGQIFMLSSLFECWNLENTYRSAWFGSTFHHQKVFFFAKTVALLSCAGESLLSSRTLKLAAKHSPTETPFKMSEIWRNVRTLNPTGNQTLRSAGTKECMTHQHSDLSFHYPSIIIHCLLWVGVLPKCLPKNNNQVSYKMRLCVCI